MTSSILSLLASRDRAIFGNEHKINDVIVGPITCYHRFNAFVSIRFEAAGTESRRNGHPASFLTKGQLLNSFCLRQLPS